MPVDALTVSVKNLGPLASPLPPATAQALHAASTPARHGRRDQTLLDKRVRDTGELRADTLALRWADGVRDALQGEVASALGLQQIEARLHYLLVYGPGQFFKPHQDTEKHSGMVATLVLVWPSPHIGGELVVRHASEQAHFASQHLTADAIRWFAFYADCRHEVLPVAEPRCRRPCWTHCVSTSFPRQVRRFGRGCSCWTTSTPSAVCIGRCSRVPTGRGWLRCAPPPRRWA